MSTPENFSVPRRRMGSKTLYLKTSGSTSSMGEPLILIRPRPALTKATATAVFYTWRGQYANRVSHPKSGLDLKGRLPSVPVPFFRKSERSSWARRQERRRPWRDGDGEEGGREKRAAPVDNPTFPFSYLPPRLYPPALFTNFLTLFLSSFLDTQHE
jgi:hypothetical protein